MSGEISSYDGSRLCSLWVSAPRQPTRTTSAVEIRIGSLDEAPFELKPEDEIWAGSGARVRLEAQRSTDEN